MYDPCLHILAALTKGLHMLRTNNGTIMLGICGIQLSQNIVDLLEPALKRSPCPELMLVLSRQ